MFRYIPFFFVSLLLPAQDGSFAISGVVLNEQTGEPIKYALVSAMGYQKVDPGQLGHKKMPSPVQKSVLAGPGGEFRFDGLPKATYNLSAQKPGFAPSFGPNGNGMAQIELADSVSGVQVKLGALGVIEGKVLDQNDDPLRGVNIIVLQAQIVDGERRTMSLRSVATDDRGVYRVWNLAKGRYYVKAAGKSGGTYRYVADNSPYYSSWQSFAPVYSGGARTLDSAQPFQIEAGSSVTADFHLTLEPAFKIRGSVANAPATTVTFDLLQGTEDVAASRAALNIANGRFEVQDVTPGSYILRVEEKGKLRGEAQLTVGAEDVDGIQVALAPAVAVKGITRVIGTPMKMSDMPGVKQAMGNNPIPDEFKKQMEQPMPVSCGVTLHERGGGAASNIPPRMRGRVRGEEDTRDGTFAIGEVLPGTYRVGLNCQGGYAMSVLTGGVDLLQNPMLTIAPGASPPPIEVQVKVGGGTLHGSLSADPLPQGAGVLLLPSSIGAGGPQMMPIYGGFNGDGKSQFAVPFLAPGDYTAYAFSDWTNVEFRNPSMLQTLSGGVSVHVEDGKDQEIKLEKIVK